MRIRFPLLLALTLALALPASADAGRTSHLWATVNICDTEKSPDSIGIRARMPGNGTRQRMWMRFRTQFYSQQDYSWQYVTKGGRSPWVELGSALFLFKETGYVFNFEPPAAGTTFLLRGVVEFQWRSKGGRVIRRTRKFTAPGHRTRNSDPAGFSAARCRIEGPAPGATPKLVEP